MSHGLSRIVAALVLFTSLDGFAAAQVAVHRGQALGGGAPAASATAASTGPAASVGFEPEDLVGMVAAHNEARARIGLSALTWSGELASRAKAVTEIASRGSCSMSAAERAASAKKGAFFWAAGIRRVAGADMPQEFSTSYPVALWSDARSDYDTTRKICRTGSPACESYSRMISPVARTVGCARTICPNQSQVWICLYGE